jgi:putative ABC transport system permease protein
MNCRRAFAGYRSDFRLPTFLLLNPESLREIMEKLIQDLRYGIRTILKQPGFTAIAVMALALGIGANTAIFSIVNAVLLRPLPFANPDGIMMVFNTAEREDRFSVTYPDFIDWRERQQSFELLAGYSSRDFTLTGTGDPVRLRGAMVTGELLPILGVQPKLGRFFRPEEDKPGIRVAILSQRMWQEHFASDPDICDKTIQLHGQSYSVAGVMPKGFAFPLQNDPVIDFWTTTASLQEGAAPLTAQRGNHALNVVGRLKEGITLEQAQADMSGIANALASQYPDTNAQFGARVVPLHKDLVREIRPALLILFGAVGCVLLIACANVANLLLARATTRHKEIAIRTALGASRLRVIRQLLTESLLLSLLGGGLGLLLAVWGTELLVALVPKGLPRADEIAMDGMVLGFTTLVALATGIFFGIAPAMQTSKTELTQTLKEGGRSSGDGAQRNRVRSLLVVSEVAIALMLLVGAGLLINSFLRLQKVNPGFNTHNVLSFRIGLPDSKYPQPQQKIDFYKQLASRIEALPGVKNVGYINALPLSGQGGGVGFSIEGEPVNPAQPFPYDTDFRTISPGYFKTMGIELLQGRDFDERDDLQSNPVVIINETLAKRYFPNQNPLGKRINPSFANDQRGPLMREIVGVVSSIKHSSLSAEIQPEAYVAYKQNARPTAMVVARTTNDPTTLIGSIRNEVQGLDNTLAIYSVRTLDEYLSASVAQPRFNTLLLGIFAAVALILTTVGLYGVMSYTVTQRTHELGIRMALGAKPADVLKLILRQGMGLTLMGIVLGLAGAFALTRVAESLLFGVSATDPLTFLMVSAFLLGVALVACLVPARRATRVDPMVALRYE